MSKESSKNFCACGIEINDDELKVAQLRRKKDKYKLVSWNKVRLPEGVIQDFEIKDVGRFSEILGSTLDSAEGEKIRQRKAVISIPEKNIFLRILSIPAAEEEELGEIIKWELEANIPVSVEEVYYDWQIVEKGGGKMKALVVACAQKKIDNIIKSFEAANIELQALEADSIANGRSVLPLKSSKPTLIIDIGLKGTGYFIYDKGYPVFSSSGSISGKFFTDAISKYYKVEWKKAEAYKQRAGLGAGPEEKREIEKVYGGLLQTLVQEIKKTISFYDEKLKSDEAHKVESIIVCGGGSNLSGLVSYLAVSLKRNVVQGDPWVKLDLGGDIPPISKEAVQSFVTVIGLSLRKCK